MHNIIAAHRRIEQTLRCLTKIAEQADQAIAILDLYGTIRFVNTAWAKMHGCETKHHITGKHIGTFHTKEQLESDVIPFIEEAKRRGRLAGPLGHVRKDGSPFPTETKMTTVKDEAGRAIAIIVFTTDMTEKNRTQQQHQQYCDRLKQQIAELTEANEKLHRQITEYQHSEEYLLESIIDAEEPAAPTEPPFNPQELKALSELAKRLT